jgi:transcription initiation factor IIE alpha subunit
MAISTCQKCNNHSFELMEQTPLRSNYKLYFVQCSSCGAVVGVRGYYDSGTLVTQQKREIDEIREHLNRIESYLSAINSRFR